MYDICSSSKHIMLSLKEKVIGGIIGGAITTGVGYLTYKWLKKKNEEKAALAQAAEEAKLEEMQNLHTELQGEERYM